MCHIILQILSVGKVAQMRRGGYGVCPVSANRMMIAELLSDSSLVSRERLSCLESSVGRSLGV